MCKGEEELARGSVRGQGEDHQLLPQGPPDPQDTDALSPGLTGLCPKEVTPVRSPVGEVLAQHSGRGSWEPLQSTSYQECVVREEEESKQDWP